MAATLAIIERAHRGAVEQQFAHVLWLAHGLHRQTPMTVLLRGVAAVYALAQPPPPPLSFGKVTWGAAPDYQTAIGRLTRDGSRVLVSASSLAALAAATDPLLPQVNAVSDLDIAELVAAHDRVWFL
ncbi:MAG TPA: hypothetical protein VFC19_07970 [Candidatus Limnocylindrales bacterium]|nr:hypothetical protein [Candidatus Limnocylindrales bacterium]